MCTVIQNFSPFIKLPFEISVPLSCNAPWYYAKLCLMPDHFTSQWKGTVTKTSTDVCYGNADISANIKIYNLNY
jgi:hypothetical protein